MDKYIEMRIAGWSKPAKVAGAIAGVIGNDLGVKIIVIGANAIAQATKALAIARKFVKTDSGRELIVFTKFGKIEDRHSDKEIVALKIYAEARDRWWG